MTSRRPIDIGSEVLNHYEQDAELWIGLGLVLPRWSLVRLPTRIHEYLNMTCADVFIASSLNSLYVNIECLQKSTYSRKKI